MRSWLVGALAVSLVASPVGATAVGPASAPVLPATEQVGQEGELAASDNTLWWIVGGVALLVLVLLLLSDDDDEELPISP